MSRLILPEQQATPVAQIAVQAMGEHVWVAVQYPQLQAQSPVTYTIEQAQAFVDSLEGEIAKAIVNREMSRADVNQIYGAGMNSVKQSRSE